MGLGNWLLGKLSLYLMKDGKIRRGYLCDFDRIVHEVRPADVLLIEGRNKASFLIKRLTQSTWSHSALYIGRLHDVEDPLLREQIHQHYKGPINAQLLIESEVGKGTIISPINKYHEHHIRICRPAGLSYHDAQKIIAYAVNSIGKEYNVRHLVDLGRFLFGSRFIPRRWKSTLFRQEPGQATQDICSSMIAQAFESVNFPVLPLIRKGEKNQWELFHRNAKLYTPSDFDYSPYFNIIKYPIFPMTEVAPYHQLPWREGMIYSDDVGFQSLPNLKAELKTKPNPKTEPAANEPAKKTRK